MVDRSDLGTPNFDFEPVLLLGRRKQSGLLEVCSLPLHEDTFEALREPCVRAWEGLANRSALTFQPHGHLETDECYVIEVDELPQKPKGRRPRKRPDDRPMQHADLLKAVQEADEHEAPANVIRSYDFNFYVIVFRDMEGAPLGFVRRISPTKALDASRNFFRVDHGSLKHVKTPDFAVDNMVDLIVLADRIVVLTASALDYLLKDVKLTFQRVPALAAMFRERLKPLGLTREAGDALEEVCQRSMRGARRLEEWGDGPGSQGLDAVDVRTAFNEQGLESLVTDSKLHFDEANVVDVLDCLTGRLYGDPLSGERRRAEKYSRR